MAKLRGVFFSLLSLFSFGTAQAALLSEELYGCKVELNPPYLESSCQLDPGCQDYGVSEVSCSVSVPSALLFLLSQPLTLIESVLGIDGSLPVPPLECKAGGKEFKLQFKYACRAFSIKREGKDRYGWSDKGYCTSDEKLKALFTLLKEVACSDEVEDGKSLDISVDYFAEVVDGDGSYFVVLGSVGGTPFVIKEISDSFISFKELDKSGSWEVKNGRVYLLNGTDEEEMTEKLFPTGGTVLWNEE